MRYLRTQAFRITANPRGNLDSASLHRKRSITSTYPMQL